MFRNALIGAMAAAMGLSGTTMSWAADLDARVSVRAATRVSVKIEISEKNQRGSTNYPTRDITSFTQTLTPNAEGFKVEQGKSTVFSDSPLTHGLSAVVNTSGAQDPFVYQADALLSPTLMLEVVTTPVLQRASRIEFDRDGTTRTIGEVLGERTTLTDQPVSNYASRFIWLKRIAPVQGVKLDLHKPILSTSQPDNSDRLLPSILHNNSIELTKLDTHASKATVVTKSAYDKVSAEKALADYIRNARADPFWSSVPSAPAATSARLKIDFSETCTYIVDTRLGLVTSVDCTTHDVRPNPSLFQWVTDTRTRITQSVED